MSAKAQHVVPNLQGGWSVRQTGSARASRVFSDQAAAVHYAREKAKKERTDLYVHGRDGTVRERDTYSEDPIQSAAKR
jgi:hypothetical protein